MLPAAFITTFGYFIMVSTAFPVYSDTAMLRLMLLSFLRRLRKKPSAASKVAPQPHVQGLQKREGLLPVQKRCLGGDGLQNKKGIDVLRTGSAGVRRGENGYLKLVASAFASEVAISEQPLHSGGLANGGGADGAGINVLRTGSAGGARGKNGYSNVVVSASASQGAINKQAAHSGGVANGSGGGGADFKPHFLYGCKLGSCNCKEKEEKAFGEGRSWLVKISVVFLLLGEMPIFASASLTLVYENTSPIPIFPSLIPTSGSPAINNSTSLGAIGPNKVRSYVLPDGWAGIGLFGTGCVSDGLSTRNCATGNCKGRDCTAEDNPVATNYIISSDGYISISAEGGYNLGLEIRNMCIGCGPPASCKAWLGSCPTELRVLDGSRALVGCKSSKGLNFYEKECTISSDYSTSTVRVSFQQKNTIVKISVSRQN